ncbi:MAG: ABC transporter permease [Pseudomonadota bacterium]|uniref:ABC transporter permease n=1 Tax=Sphingomonas sp. ERG5 TaxID=1381597 RepID=UPI000B2F73B0|nr:ABC transporter permease [Sphingomonas sp. ERG5]
MRFLAASFWDLALVTWVPLLLMAAVAIQLSAGVMRDLPIAVVDQDGTTVSRELTRRLDAAPGLHVVAQATDMKEAERIVRSNRAYAVVLIPTDTERSVLRGTTGSIITFYNASYSTASGAALREVGNVVQGYAATLAAEQSTVVVGPGKVRRPPVAARSIVLFNPQGSYELQLVALIHPALLHLIFMVAVSSALGRELRDGTIGAWIGGNSRRRAVLAVMGKLTPYLVIFTGWGLLATGYLAGVRGWPVVGSVLLLLVGYVAMYLAYIGVTLLVVGLTLSMGRALSIAGLYAGASFAFAGAIFPLESASAFARLWSLLLPYSAFAKLLAEQWIMGASVMDSLWQVLVMLAFLIVGAGIGLPRYLAAARRPETWGRR